MFIYLKNLEFFLKDDQFKKLYFFLVKNWEFPYEVSKIGKIGNLVFWVAVWLNKIFLKIHIKKSYHQNFTNFCENTGATINHKRAKCQVIQIKIVATRVCQSDHKVSKIGDFSWICYLGHHVWLRIKQKTDNGVPILNTLKRLNIYKCGIVGIGMECSLWWNTCFFKNENIFA